jgi:hypothetical protein
VALKLAGEDVKAAFGDDPVPQDLFFLFGKRETGFLTSF